MLKQLSNQLMLRHASTTNDIAGFGRWSVRWSCSSFFTEAAIEFSINDLADNRE